MNIFFLSPDPRRCATWLHDNHIRKMYLETAQMLCTAHRVLDGEKVTVPSKDGKRMLTTYIFRDEEKDKTLYKSTHVNHPTCKWVRSTNMNYRWTYEHLFHLLDEYNHRFGKLPKTAELLETLAYYPKNIQPGLFTLPPAVVDDEFKKTNVLDSYFLYYAKTKIDENSKWTNRAVPNIFKELINV